MIPDFFKLTDVVEEDGRQSLMYVTPPIPVSRLEKEDIDDLYPRNQGAFYSHSIFVDMPYWNPES